MEGLIWIKVILAIAVVFLSGPLFAMLAYFIDTKILGIKRD